MKRSTTCLCVSAATVLPIVLGPALAAADESGRVPPPGASAQLVTGDARVGEAREERRSTGKMVTGIILSSCGVVNGSVGAALLVSAADCSGDLCGFRSLFGASFVGLGATLLAVGVPLWVIGAGDPAPEDRAGGLAPAVVVGGGNVGARWSF